MVTPTQKIGLGVAEINAAKTDNTPPPKVDLSRFAKGPKNLSEVISMVSELRLSADAFEKRMATLQAEEKKTARANHGRGEQVLRHFSIAED